MCFSRCESFNNQEIDFNEIWVKVLVVSPPAVSRDHCKPLSRW